MRQALVFVIAAILLVGCAQIPPSDQTLNNQTPTEQPMGDAQSFASAQELQAFLEEHPSSGSYGEGMERTAVADDSSAAPQKADYSGTNVQVQGIDEGDILKTDGEYIYTITQNTLFILKAYPGDEAEVVDQINFDNNPTGLFLSDDTLIVYGSFYDTDYFSRHEIRPRNGMSFLNMYDVSDKANIELEKEFKFEGRPFESRMKDGMIYLVTQSAPEARPLPMPLIIEDDVVRNVEISNVFRYDMPYTSPQFANVHAISLGSGNVKSATFMVENVQTMYMGHDNLYIAGTRWINEWELRQDIMVEMLEDELPASDKEIIRKIKDADPEVLSASEKKQKIAQVYSEYVEFLPRSEREDLQDRIEGGLKDRLSDLESLEWTILHRVELSQLLSGGSIEIPGSLNNQFALDEKDGVLRAATTLSANRWIGIPEPLAETDNAIAETMIAPMPPRDSSSSSVFTIDVDGMEIMDRISGIARGESIFATRFIDDRLYMVTFEQIDPFFVIDLSDPRNTEVLGELKIPGFSRYLHPYDENVIIGFGRDASETGRQRGLKVSLFDVSDVSEPREIVSWSAEESSSYSNAEYEHKAFLFDRDKNLMVLPVYSHGDYRSGEAGYSGAFVFRVNHDEIELRGLIDHGAAQRYSNQVERSLFIEDLLYTKSPYLLRINELDDLDRVKDVELNPKSDAPYIVY